MFAPNNLYQQAGSPMVRGINRNDTRVVPYAPTETIGVYRNKFAL